VQCVCKRWHELISRTTSIVGRNDWSLFKGATENEGIITLTEAEEFASGAALCKAKISTKDDTTIRITFHLYAGGNLGGKYSGDGIAFFIVDADQHDGKSIGQFGSALGYACLASHGRHKGIPHGLLGIGFDEFGNFARHMEGKDGLRDKAPCKWSVCMRGPGHETTGYKFLCCEKSLPPWSELWTKVDVTLKIVKRNLFLTLYMENDSMQKIIWTDFNVDLTLPDNIGIGFSASTGQAINKHQVKDVQIVEKFFSEEFTTPVGKQTIFHTVPTD